ncbi:MAG: putative sulfate exporter family transporter [Chloroflexota bacterium]
MLYINRFQNLVTRYVQGVLIAIIVAIAARFLAEHYGAPAMLMALLLGMALNFLSEQEKCIDGVALSASTFLRLGVALLGARVSVELLNILSIEVILVIIFSVVATIAFGFVGAKMLGRGWRLAILSGGAVAICGASAAMAIASVLPKNEHSDRNLSFTIVSVTVLSTIAMIAYPAVLRLFELNEQEIGIFLGGTIHDVAQVVGAGFTVSEETGEIATVVKLMRVSMLAPLVLFIALAIRYLSEQKTTEGEKPPVLPYFILGFLLLAVLNSFSLIPSLMVTVINDLSAWLLLIAISAVGMRTSLKTIMDVGGQSIALIVAETVFIASFVIIGIVVFM